jgi:hypothetical protein
MSETVGWVLLSIAIAVFFIAVLPWIKRKMDDK